LILSLILVLDKKNFFLPIAARHGQDLLYSNIHDV
jgi:hypothetical protein